jgi:Tol biopolymer transport system component
MISWNRNFQRKSIVQAGLWSVSHQVLRKNEEDYISGISISADNKYIYFVREDRKLRNQSIIKLDLETGLEKELYRTTEGNITITLSPDGKQLAVMVPQKESTRILKILSTMESSENVIHKFNFNMNNYISMAWSPDGRYIYFSKMIDSDIELCRIHSSGGEVENLGVEMYGFASISIHPDGQLITFASRVGMETSGSVWVMENFLPKEETSNTQ